MMKLLPFKFQNWVRLSKVINDPFGVEDLAWSNSCRSCGENRVELWDKISKYKRTLKKPRRQLLQDLLVIHKITSVPRREILWDQDAGESSRRYSSYFIWFPSAWQHSTSVSYFTQLQINSIFVVKYIITKFSIDFPPKIRRIKYNEKAKEEIILRQSYFYFLFIIIISFNFSNHIVSNCCPETIENWQIEKKRFIFLFLPLENVNFPSECFVKVNTNWWWSGGNVSTWRWLL